MIHIVYKHFSWYIFECGIQNREEEEEKSVFCELLGTFYEKNPWMLVMLLDLFSFEEYLCQEIVECTDYDFGKYINWVHNK